MTRRTVQSDLFISAPWHSVFLNLLANRWDFNLCEDLTARSDGEIFNVIYK